MCIMLGRRYVEQRLVNFQKRNRKNIKLGEPFIEDNERFIDKFSFKPTKKRLPYFFLNCAFC